MQTISAIDLKWLADAFQIGQPQRITRVIHGQSSPYGVLCVETSQGLLGVKQYIQPPNQTALQVELAAHRAGIPMPQPVWTRQGQPYAAYHHSSNTIWIRVYSWVEGNACECGTVDPAVSFEVGRLLAKLHAVPVSSDVAKDAPWSAAGRQNWRQWAAQAANMRLTWAATLREKMPALLAWEKHIAQHTVEGEVFVPSQRDLHPPNVICRNDGTLALVDWDGAGLVIAREEVAKFALVWAKKEDQSPSTDAVHAFVQGYREAGGVYRSRGIFDFTHQYQSLLWWIAHNVQRDLSRIPGANPELTLALLAGISHPDIDSLRQTAALLVCL